MEAVATSTVKNFFNKMMDDVFHCVLPCYDQLKTGKISIFGKYICMLAAIMMVFSAFGASSFWWCILNFLIALFVFALEYLKCFTCFKEVKPIDEKLEPLRTPLYKGCIYLVAGILFWQSGFITSVVAIIGGLFLVLGSFFDKKQDGSKAPMV